MLGDATYSEREIKLFAHFKMADIAYNIQPPLLYTMLAYRAFLTNDQTSMPPRCGGALRLLKALKKTRFIAAPLSGMRLLETANNDKCGICCCSQ